MKPIKIGILDSGVDLKTKYLAQFVKKGWSISENRTFSPLFDDDIGHGTAIADLITKDFSSNEIEIYIYKIFSKEISIQTDILIEAFHRILEDDIHILNCSFGTVDPNGEYDLELAINSLLEKKIIIVAAWNDCGYTTWPANFKDVISIKAGNQRNRKDFFWEKNKKDHFLFRGTKQRVKWKNNNEIFIGGSSLATALCSNILAKQFTSDNLIPNLDECRNYLKNNSKNITSVDLVISDKIYWNRFSKKIKKAGLFPFNKEMHGFVRFRQNLDYNIGWIADLKFSKNIKKRTNQVLDNCTDAILIEPGLPRDPEDIDTLIIGYLEKASLAQNKNLLHDSLSYALTHNLNVFSFQPPENFNELSKAFTNNSLWIEVPMLDNEYVHKVMQNIDVKHALDTPILGIFGSSSNQGKFTLQLALRYELIRRGLNIAQIGTEHQSGCFGIELTFASGHGSERTLKIPLQYHIPYLRCVLSEFDKKNYDLILVGAQSGLLNPDPYNYQNIYSELFLSATIPDYIVLIINEFDEKYFIDRIKKYLYSKTGHNNIQEISFNEIKNDTIGIANKIVNSILN